jgi:hypothetical protein
MAILSNIRRSLNIRPVERSYASAAVLGGMAMLLASLLAGAGVIHLVMVPSHIDEWMPEGVAFAIAGWLQIAAAAAVVTRPSRILNVAIILVSAGLIAAWAVSRTVGLPLGPHGGEAETMGFVDLACVGLEAGAIALAALALSPRLVASTDRILGAVPYVAAVAILALATAAVASPSARDHANAHSHGDDRGLSLLTNGHHHAITQQALDAPTQALLDDQLRATRAIARQYPTVADAEAAGYRRAGPFSPGLGAHYLKYGPAELNADGVIDGDDASHPLAIIYDGTDPDSAVAGFMFYSTGQFEPQGFAGPNDTWHYHERICLKSGADGVIEAPFGPDNAATDEQCAAVGGSIITTTQWMVHVWSVPGYNDVDGGTFAEVNPDLDCPDDTYYQLPPDEWAAHPLSTCRPQAS